MKKNISGHAISVCIEKHNSWLYVVIVVLALAVAVPSFMQTDSADGTLSATATSKISSSPDEAVVSIAVETLADSASDSQQQNAAIMDKVIAAIKGEGVPSDSIDTSGYNVYPDYSYALNERKLLGYRTINTVSVTTNDLAGVGSIIDGASSAGANRVDSLQFQLSDAKMESVRAQLLSDAAAKAREKASSMASAAGVKLGRVVSVSESSPYSPPVYYAKAEALDSAVQTPIQPSDVEVSGSVTIVYRI